VQARIVGAARGARWIGEGWQLFRAAPLGWLALVFAYWLIMTLVSIVPFAGVVAAAVMVPAFSVGFMAAARAAARRAPLELGLLFEGFRAQRRTQLVLGAVYFVCLCGVLGATTLVDDGALGGWMLTGRRPEDEVLQSDAFAQALLCAAVLYTPVMMLTAKGLPEDVAFGLEAGADDYLPKPFDLPVLLARVKGLIRRRDWARGSTVDAVRVGPALVDFANFELRKGDSLVRLTLLEAMLLKLLVEKRGQVVTKAEILEKVWNLNPDTETRAVDNFVMRLRRHLEEDARDPRLLQTVRGVGYRLQD